MSIKDDMAAFTDLTVTPPQNDFLQLTCKHPAFVAGFGTGKSQTMALSATLDASEGGADAVIAILEPTFDLCKLIAVPRIELMLDTLGIRYKTVANKDIYTSHSGIGDFLFRSMDNPARLVGWEAFRIHCDEIDTLKKEDAKGVWRACIARCRQTPKEYLPFSFLPADRPMNRVSAYCTPEGFNFLYGRWAKDKERSRRAGYLMIQAGTHTNPFLPPDYLDSLRASYDPQRFNAYANGQFVNLVGGSIYRNFDRHLNDTNEEIIPGEPLIVGQDFNVNKMASVFYVMRLNDSGEEELHAVDEIKDGIDTPDVITRVREKYVDGAKLPHPIMLYPDASGQNTSSKGASVSDVSMLMSAGFEVYCGSSNPAIKDRIIAVNRMICDTAGKRRLFVSQKRCPTFVECLEQQIYDPKTNKPDKEAGKDHMNDAGGYPVSFRYPVIHNLKTNEVSIGWTR